MKPLHEIASAFNRDIRINDDMIISRFLIGALQELLYKNQQNQSDSSFANLATSITRRANELYQRHF